MTRDNLRAAERLYEAWDREEFPGPPGLLDPDIEYVNPDGAVEPGIRRGLDAFSAAIERVAEGWASWQMRPERFTAIGEHVAVVVRYRGVARASGIEIEGRESALLTLREGKIVRYAWFHSPDDAAEAATGPR